MCNLYRLTKGADALRKAFGRQLSFPEGIPNVEPRDVRITERAPIVRAAAAGAELVERRWSWPGPTGKPVYNFRAEGRDFPRGRCLIVADGFYEFTAPADPGQKRKDRWLFALAGGGELAIAGLVRDHPGVGEAFTMLTIAPGPDVAPYHGRQVAVLREEEWERWLDPAVPAAGLLRPLPAGSLTVTPA